MQSNDKTTVTVRATIHAPVEVVWKYWRTPEDIVRWNNASDDWHTPAAENDLREGGYFNYRMEARDMSTGFDFGGIYSKVLLNKLIEYTIGDGRKVKVAFNPLGDQTEIVETFETETLNPVELQRKGWQAILDNFKKYVESQKPLHQ